MNGNTFSANSKAPTIDMMAITLAAYMKCYVGKYKSVKLLATFSEKKTAHEE